MERREAERREARRRANLERREMFRRQASERASLAAAQARRDALHSSASSELLPEYKSEPPPPPIETPPSRGSSYRLMRGSHERTLQRTHRGALWASGAAQAAQVVRIILRRYGGVCELRRRRCYMWLSSML